MTLSPALTLMLALVFISASTAAVAARTRSVMTLRVGDRGAAVPCAPADIPRRALAGLGQVKKRLVMRLVTRHRPQLSREVMQASEGTARKSCKHQRAS